MSTTCPDWCDAPRIHAGDTYDQHVHDVIETDTVLTYVVQHVDNGQWLVPVEVEPRIDLCIWGNESAIGMTGTEAREIARSLMAAATKLDEITGGAA
ncbi:hypothetical protein [Aeromicrobium sp. CTD01-1L150]|uniref:hypothetical protein n=1 Tax=Aeromicrobium sp. CTD01-1L150 TaxID=3341830 RepID=UPI0035C1967D